ncbi:hypothetical protein GQ55_1G048900 [Panicum hallii var. hallii]|uniref:Uncharacterized protein n=1 Tax=Panicum hallii var. hallii TaxID=1504633 RepID=A0A2T7F2E0_9POAL|nr:hypothetical protein GQ55_1G048900 [Panicum hallii var. hallii]
MAHCVFNGGQLRRPSSRSCVVSTERTILSPFTKEYRVLATQSSIRLFLEGALALARGRPTIQN